MARLTSGLLLVLGSAVLAAWNAPRLQECTDPPGARESPEGLPSQVDGAPPPAVPREVDEGKAQPPGRDDPNEFYKKAPRKPRELRHVYVRAPPAPLAGYAC